MKYTIQDLTDGKYALFYDKSKNSITDLREILTLAFPDDKAKASGVNSGVYFKDPTRLGLKWQTTSRGYNILPVVHLTNLIPINPSRFSIQDLADGKCTLRCKNTYPSSLKLLRRILKLAFPDYKRIPTGAIHGVYSKLFGSSNKWRFTTISTLPEQFLEEFISLVPKTSLLKTGRGVIKASNIKFEIGDYIYCNREGGSFTSKFYYDKSMSTKDIGIVVGVDGGHTQVYNPIENTLHVRFQDSKDKFIQKISKLLFLDHLRIKLLKLSLPYNTNEEKEILETLLLAIKANLTIVSKPLYMRLHKDNAHNVNIEAIKSIKGLLLLTEHLNLISNENTNENKIRLPDTISGHSRQPKAISSSTKRQASSASRLVGNSVKIVRIKTIIRRNVITRHSVSTGHY